MLKILLLLLILSITGSSLLLQHAQGVRFRSPTVFPFNYKDKVDLITQVITRGEERVLGGGSYNFVVVELGVILLRRLRFLCLKRISS